MEEQTITISMKTPAWNIVINALAQRPFGEVASVVAELQNQASSQLSQAPVPAPVEE